MGIIVLLMGWVFVMPYIRTLSLALAVVVVTNCETSARAADPIDDLIAKVPDQANALVAIDLKGLHASPLAQRENWGQKHQLDILSGSLPFPASAELALLASHLEPGTLRSTWTLGMVRGNQQLNLADLAKQERGETQTLADVSAVFTGKNSIFIGLDPKTLAVVSPANRQDAARWVRFAQKNTTPAVSSYLQQGIADLKSGYHIVVALDLGDAVDLALTKRFISQSPLVKGKKVDQDALARVLAGARGIRIGIRVEQNIRATLAGDFSEDIQPFAAVLPGLMLKALDDMGADLDEFPAAAATIDKKTFLITAQLSNKGLQQILSMIPPVTAPMVAKGAPKPAVAPAPKAQPPADDQALASKRFFDSVNRLSNDAHSSAEKKQDYIRAAQAYEKAATQIDNLSVANVDEELMGFATLVSSRLRSIAEALRGAILEATALENEKQTNARLVHPGGLVGGTIGYWNPSFPNDPRYPQGIFFQPYVIPPQYNVQTNEPQVQAKQAEILAKGARKRLDLWRQLQTDVTLIKRKMTTKYKMDF
jgi:hypothetical protein